MPFSTTLNFLDRPRNPQRGASKRCRPSVRAPSCRRVLWIGIVAVLTAQAAEKKPVAVCSFEQDADLKVVRPSGVRAQRVRQHATDGEYALKCVFPGNDRDTWPGLSWRPREGTRVSDFDMFSLDVFNPGPDRVHLSWRIDDAAGRKVFSGTALPPGRLTRVDIGVRRKTGSPKSRRITQIYPYVRCPRKDATLFFDNFRLTYFSLRFTPLVYREDGPFVQPTTRDRRRGAQFFFRHWMDFVFPVSRPRPGEDAARLELTAAPGETEPATVTLRALRSLRKVRARITALRGPQGTEIPPSAASVYVVRNLNKRVTYSSTQYVADLPVYLSRQADVDIPRGRSQRFWLDVQVPENAAPGLYTGSIRIEAADGLTPAAIPLRLRVWPFRLDEPSRILGDYYQSPRPAVTDAEKHARLEKDLRDMRARGATSVGLCFGCPVEQAVLEADGTVRLNLPGDSLYVHFMNLYRDLGFPAPLVQLTDSGQAFCGVRKIEFGTPAYAAAYKGFWKAMQAEAKERGWPEIIVQPVDEPGWKDAAARERNVALLKLLKQIPGLRTEQDGPGDAYFHRGAGPWADVWNYNGALGTDEQLRNARRDGRLIMIYNCDVESWRPEMDRYIAGFFQERAGIDGCYNWAYMSYHGSPYDDLDAKTGTWMHIYPELDNEPGGPSVGWQGFREGVDDLRYVTTLRNTIRRARKSGKAPVLKLAAEAEANLNGLLRTLRYDRRQRGTARWAAKKYVGKRYEIRGPYSLPNGWSFAEYDAARRLVAADTWRLLAALGRAPAFPAGEPANVPEAAAVIRVLSAKDRSTGLDTAGVEPRTVPFVNIPVRPTGRIKVDGRTDEPAWRNAARIPGLVLVRDGARPLAATQVRLLADPATLYVAFECMEPKIAHLTATVTKDGGLTWKDDCVELFVDPAGAGRDYRQIVVNCLGKQFWSATDRKSWRARSTAAARIGTDRWTAELAVPLDDLGIRSGRVFGLNLCRERRPMEAFELSAWSPTGGKFGLPGRFGSALIGGNCGLRKVVFGAPTAGEQVCRAEIAGRGVPVRYRLDVTVAAGGKPVAFRGRPVDVPAKGVVEAECAYRLDPDPRARATVLAAVLVELNGGTETPVIRLQQRQRVRPLLDALEVSPAIARSGAVRTFQAAVFAPASLRPRLQVTALLIGGDAETGREILRRGLALPAAGPLRGELDLRGVRPGLYSLVLRCRPPGPGAEIELRRAVIVVPEPF